MATDSEVTKYIITSFIIRNFFERKRVDRNYICVMYIIDRVTSRVMGHRELRSPC